MSVIAGIVQNGKVYMGGDSASINSQTQALELRADSKVFRIGQYLIGVVGNGRITNELRYASFPTFADGDPLKHLVTTLLPVIRLVRNVDDYGLLVGFAGRLFRVYGPEQAVEESAGYNAAGCAAPIALGSLYSTDREPHVSPEVRIKLALQASERFNSGVRGPFSVLSI